MQLQVLCTGGMNRHERAVIVAAVQRRFGIVAPYLTERCRRIWAAAEAATIGPHGITLVAEAIGLSRTTIHKAQQEVAAGSLPPGDRQRRPGGGRKPLIETDLTLLEDLDRLIDPTTRGDPESPLRWTCKSTGQLAEALHQQGHAISQPTVYRLLGGLGIPCRAIARRKKGPTIRIGMHSFSSFTARSSGSSGGANR
jgi:hypothetical protein